VHQPRIVVADDHPEILNALCLLLKDVGEVVERVGNGHALVEAVYRLKPDIVITDLAMPGLDGLQATRVLRRCVPDSKIIILTVHRAAVYVSLAIEAGASGYVLKLSAGSELPQAVLHVFAGDGYIGQGVGRQHIAEWKLSPASNTG
jgi:DNA-binding NarL/FixJ family response regulator